MAGLQRSSISFRRQGSSGIVWDDKLLSGELGQQLVDQNEQGSITATAAADTSATSDGNRAALPQEQELIKTEEQQGKEDHHHLVVKVDRSRSRGRAAFRTGRVSPAIEPKSPKVSACGCCGAFGKHEKTRRKVRSKPGMRKM